MTTRSTILTAVLAVAALWVGCATGRSARRGGLSDAEVAALPATVGDAYELFAQKCSRCHTLARPLSADISDDAHWERYVGRMRRQAGSGISADDAEKILHFLKYYSKRRNATAADDNKEDSW